MSIIGTRPPLISETLLYELHHRARLAIKPGITGMWQISGRSDITDFEEVVRLATSKSQASAIKNQLWDKASICIEPCRRDTFPAIALAATYLHDELGIGSDEAVVVCPVDPYVDNTYYESVKQLQKLAEQGNANLTLMGIEPTYPSEK